MVPVRRHPAMRAVPVTVMMTVVFVITVIGIRVLPDPPRLAVDMPAVAPAMPIMPWAAVVTHVIGAVTVMVAPAPIMRFSCGCCSETGPCPGCGRYCSSGQKLFQHPIPLKTTRKLYIGSKRTNITKKFRRGPLKISRTLHSEPSPAGFSRCRRPCPCPSGRHISLSARPSPCPCP